MTFFHFRSHQEGDRKCGYTAFERRTAHGLPFSKEALRLSEVAFTLVFRIITIPAHVR